MTNAKDDAELLRCYAEEHSDAAFAELVQRHVGFVYGAALRQLNGAVHRAEDVTQQVFIDLARKAETLAPRTEIVSWLHTSTHYAAAKLKRDEQRRQQREQEIYSMQEIFAGTTGDHVDWEQLRPVLDSTLRELDERDRVAILLRFFRGLRFAEIGQRLGMSEDGARMRTERALEKLQGLLARRKITSTTGALALLLANQPAVAVPTKLAASVTAVALAEAAALGAASGVFSLLAAKTGTVLGLAVMGLAIGVAVYQNNPAQRSRERTEATGRERGELRPHVDLSSKSNAAEKERSPAPPTQVAQREREVPRPKQGGAFEAAPDVVRVDKEGPAVIMGDGREPVMPGIDGNFTIMTISADPVEQRKRVRSVTAKAVDSAYAALYQELNWTADQREQFKTMMLDYEESGAELRGKAVATARATNPVMDRAEQFEIFEAAQAQTQREQQAEVRRIFGEVAGQAMEHFQMTLPMRLFVRQLTDERLPGEPPLTITPLTLAQADQLIEIMANNALGTVSKVDVAALNIDAVVAQVRERELLNEAQLAELQTQVVRSQRQQKAQRLVNMMPAAEFRAKYGR